MKKKILFISLFLLAVFVYLKRGPQEEGQLVKQEKASPVSPILKKETKKQVQVKPKSTPPKKEKEQTSSTFNPKEYLKARKDFQNFNIDTETLLENWKKEKLQKYLTQASNELLQCLEENLCGEQEPVDSPYFNPDYTDSHTYLEHNLGHLVFLHERRELNLDQLTDDFLQRLLTLKNEGIQQKAIELKLAKGIDSKNYDELLRLTEKLTSKATLSSLAVLSQYSQKAPQHRQTFIQTLKRVIEDNNQLRAVEVAKRLKNYELNWEELSNLSEKVHCNQRPQNQKAIRHYLLVEAEGHGRKLDLTCR